MDSLDRSIVTLLQKDGRMRFTEIARALGVTEGTVRYRVAKLLDNKAIQIIGVLDPHRMGYLAPAIIGVSIQPPHLESAAEAIAAMPEVSYLIMVAGEFDLIVEVFCRDREHLASFLRDQLLKVDGVQRTQTSFILHTYKVAHGAQTVLAQSLPPVSTWIGSVDVGHTIRFDATIKGVRAGKLKEMLQFLGNGQYDFLLVLSDGQEAAEVQLGDRVFVVDAG